MCFLTDANRLYSHALGLYDLELTLLVAQQAQMVIRYPRRLYFIANTRIGPARVSSVLAQIAAIT